MQVGQLRLRGSTHTQGATYWLVKRHEKNILRQNSGYNDKLPVHERWRGAQGGAIMRAYKWPVECTMVRCSRRRKNACVQAASTIYDGKMLKAAFKMRAYKQAISVCCRLDAQDEQSTECKQRRDTRSHTLTGEGECWK